MRRAVHVVITGRVQGVGFRAFVEREAEALRLDGWVRNRRDGTVEAVFAGERCRYMLSAGDGTSMVLKEPSSAAIRRRAVGERVEISWSVADTILV